MRFSPLVVLVIIILAVMVTAGASAAAYVGVRQLVIDSPIELPAPPQLGAQRPTAVPLVQPTETPQPTAPGSTPQPTLAPGITPTVPTWSDPKRVNVLLLGIDQRPNEPGPFRTDTIIVLSLDPVRKTGAMLSIPRDVYVPIPGYEEPLSPNRINAANFIGDSTLYPGGGAKLAAKTVEALLGIPIHRSVLVNFQAFITIIDALGPVEVCPTERIFDDKYPDTETYGVITVEFQPGCQELDATRLLQYARVRHNAGDDIGRARRQQEVIQAVRKKALSLGGVSALIGQAGPIWDSLRDNLKTDLTLDEIIQLAGAAQGITDIKSEVLTIRTQNGGQLLLGKDRDGNDIFSPVAEDIFTLVVRLFDSGQGGQGRAAEENAAVYVANGAGVDGLARRIADQLTPLGFNIAGVGNAEGVGLYGQSEIVVYTGKTKTARYLAEVLGLESTVIRVGTEGPAGIDIQVIVGKDLAGQ